MSKTIYAVKLTETEIPYLESVLRQPTSEARHYIRAKMLLLKHKNYSSDRIAYNLDIAPSTVKLCVKRYAGEGIEAALNNRKGRGRKPEISDADITWVIDKACKKPAGHGILVSGQLLAVYTFRGRTGGASPDGGRLGKHPA